MVVSFCDGCIDSLSLNDDGFSFCGEEAREWAKTLSHWFLDAEKNLNGTVIWSTC